MENSLGSGCWKSSVFFYVRGGYMVSSHYYTLMISVFHALCSMHITFQFQNNNTHNNNKTEGIRVRT